jgi:hypothetical protein
MDDALQVQLLVGAIDWGPVAVWVGTAVTFLTAVIALLVALGVFDRALGPRLRLAYEQREPWSRPGHDPVDGDVVWVRISVENVGRKSARGCVGRLVAITTDGEPRSDIDPVQLRWAGVPRTQAFEPIDIRPRQREFLDVACLHPGQRLRIVTFDDPSFEPGFSTELNLDRQHDLEVGVFADNADTRNWTLEWPAAT